MCMRVCVCACVCSVCVCVRVHACSCTCVASSPGFSLLPRNNLRMTFDQPERKADPEGEPGPFSHMIATRIYVRVTRFYVKAALKHGIVTLGTQSDHG